MYELSVIYVYKVHAAKLLYSIHIDGRLAKVEQL